MSSQHLDTWVLLRQKRKPSRRGSISTCSRPVGPIAPRLTTQIYHKITPQFSWFFFGKTTPVFIYIRHHRALLRRSETRRRLPHCTKSSENTRGLIPRWEYPGYSMVGVFSLLVYFRPFLGCFGTKYPRAPPFEVFRVVYSQSNSTYAVLLP
jgi:hypothetical protein